MGINTEWGLLMASISEDNGEETPLQVGFFCLCYFLLFVLTALVICPFIVLFTWLIFLSFFF